MPGFIAMVVLSALIAWVGNSLTGDTMPAGFWGTWVVALLGSWVGAYAPVFNTAGPVILGIAIIPAILGALAFVFFLGLFKGILRQAR